MGSLVFLLCCVCLSDSTPAPHGAHSLDILCCPCCMLCVNFCGAHSEGISGGSTVRGGIARSAVGGLQLLRHRRMQKKSSRDGVEVGRGRLRLQRQLSCQGVLHLQKRKVVKVRVLRDR